MVDKEAGERGNVISGIHFCVSGVAEAGKRSAQGRGTFQDLTVKLQAKLPTSEVVQLLHITCGEPCWGSNVMSSWDHFFISLNPCPVLHRERVNSYSAIHVYY